MSYDLMVFDPAMAPATRDEFIEWYYKLTSWGAGHDYNDPNVASPALRKWLEVMIAAFPPMNGPFASDDYEDPRVSDYSIDPAAIYVTFAWSEAEAALRTVVELAAKHGVGFFDVSANDGDILVPSSNGQGLTPI